MTEAIVVIAICQIVQAFAAVIRTTVAVRHEQQTSEAQRY